ncbi:MAG: UDP-N-acetylmuramate dehydrogenase [Candidatus Zeuxoniibacter abyssi]|nr:MAG: UDP-N-acetylmuramate dehydrogenase [Candidatus Persebacteraceae bacterium AB1(2)]
MNLNGLWRENYPMAKLSTWRVGGPARVLFTPADMEDLRCFLLEACEDFLMIGYGSNLLVRDGGVDEVVIRTAPGLCTLRREKDGLVYAEAGVGCPKLARFCVKNGLSGGEFFAGVPGTVGGALAMNAGCHGQETWQRVEKAMIFDGEGGFYEITAADADIGYRSVRLKNASDDMRFAAAWFNFAVGCEAKSRVTMRDLLNHRNDTQPIGLPTAGSVFCNPPNDYAAKLIEQCGLKGMRIGGAEVSRKHVNFIVNKGDATAEDIENLMSKVRDTVREKTGVTLCPEVRVVGKRKSHV